MSSEIAETKSNKMWKPELYKIQLEAPTAKIIRCSHEVERPLFFGAEYHGILSHKEAAFILDEEQNGSYLVRKGSELNDFFTLSWRFNDKVNHYKLYYDGRYYVKDKRYESMSELVADGLVALHMELHASHITQRMHAKAAYLDSPYVTLNRKKLKALSDRVNEKSVDGSEDGYFINGSVPLPPVDKSVEAISQDLAHSDLGSRGEATTPSSATLVEKFTKEHNFKLHTFKGLNWCEFCANFLWGFTAQGVKCEDCGFTAHSKCSANVPAHCAPALQRLRGVFGLDLTTLLGGAAGPDARLPFVVRRCVTEIERRGMEQEGIYRISGFADEIEALKMALDKDGEAANLEEYSNINVVAGCLKLYLRLLPLPLLTHQLHPKLVAATYLKTPAEQISTLREVLTELPPAHYNTLQYMIQHLHRVSLLSNINKMTPHNLSTVFAPTLMAVPAHCTDLTQEIHVLELLITHAARIFGT